MKKYLWITIILSICIAGCEGGKLTVSEPEVVPATATQYDGGFSLFVEKELPLALYEPPTGCLTGAYILSDKSVERGISSFEELTGKEQSFYTYFMKIGQPFPSEWVLECISQMKTPNIVLAPENYDEPYNAKYLEDVAKKFGEFYVPMFVHFYPVSEAYGQDGEAYKSFYKIARAYFKEYASNVAFVWDMDFDSLALLESFYPGDEYVDWAGVNIYVNSYDDNGSNIERALAGLDYFYYTFQENKPVFISQLGISHFFAEEHAYMINQAKDVMESFYKDIEAKYPRVKAVNYMSYNGLEPVNMKGGNYNYSVADNGRMSAIYSSCVNGGYFLSELDFSGGGETSQIMVKYPFEAFYGDGEFFVEYANASILKIGGSLLSINEKGLCALDEVYNGEYIIDGNFNKRVLNVTKP